MGSNNSRGLDEVDLRSDAVGGIRGNVNKAIPQQPANAVPATMLLRPRLRLFWVVVATGLTLRLCELTQQRGKNKGSLLISLLLNYPPEGQEQGYEQGSFVYTVLPGQPTAPYHVSGISPVLHTPEVPQQAK